MPLMSQITDHAQSKELEVISNIIDANPIICERVLQDLNRGKNVAYRKGADGMSAEQVLRSAIVKTLYNFSYKDLAFHLVDSQSLSWFCRIGIADKGFKKSALNKNIKTISAATWQMINTDLLGYAKDKKIEKGRKVRIDCTCVESNIHKPTDSSLLWDAVRVLTRLMEQCRDAVDKGIHIGGAFSAVIPLVSLFYGGVMQLDIADPTKPGQDMFVLSKGHAVAPMASIYADIGYFDKSVLKNSRSEPSKPFIDHSILQVYRCNYPFYSKAY